MYWILLQCIIFNWIALYFIDLYCILMNCAGLYFIVTYQISLQCIEFYCNAFSFSDLHCILLNCIAFHCIMLYCIACIHKYRLVPCFDSMQPITNLDECEKHTVDIDVIFIEFLMLQTARHIHKLSLGCIHLWFVAQEVRRHKDLDVDLGLSDDGCQDPRQ